MLKTLSLAVLPIGILAFACGSTDDSSGFAIPGGVATGGIRAIGTGQGGGQGGSSINLSQGGSSGTGPGTAGSSNITGSSTLDQLRTGSCAGWSSEPESLPALLQFVVDTSGSMDEKAPSTGRDTKWEVTAPALSTALGQLPASTGVGMLFYPNMITTNQECVRTDAIIPIDLLGGPGSAHRTRLDAGIAGIMPQSYTPTYDAYNAGITLGLNPSTLPGKRFVVLLTDGAPTVAQDCVRTGGGNGGGGVAPVDPQPIVQQIQAAFDQDRVQTFIIGAPGSEESINGTDARVAWLSAAARVGGTASAGCSDTGPNFCHIDLTQSTDFAAALQQSLAQIAGAVVSCAYDLPTPAPGQTLDLNAINVVYTGGDGTQTLVGRSTDPNCVDGWQLAGTQVQLCSNTCTQAKADSKAGIELIFGCATVTTVK